MPTAQSVCRAWRRQLVQKTLPKALEDACELLAHQVEKNAPKVTNDLANSVRATRAFVRPKRISAAVLVTSDHALAVEYGTSEMLPDPYFRPAIESEVPRMIAIVSKVVGS